MVPATSQYSLVSGGKLKFNQKLFGSCQVRCCLGLHIYPGSWMSLQPALDPTLMCHPAGSGKRTYTAVTALSDTGGTQAVRDPGRIFLYLQENNPALLGCWSFQPEDDLLNNLF